MAKNPRIGSLRWLVTLATRAQAAQDGGTGIDEPWVKLMAVHADITALRDGIYWDAMNTETPVSHLIRIRWVNVVDNTQAVLRVINLPDSTTRTEVYRVRRFMEIEGRKRFVDLQCQLERAL